MLLSTRRFAFPSADPFTSMRREMDQLFGLGRFFNDVPENGGAARGWYAPGRDVG